MDASTCPGCRERGARLAELERRVAELEARLGTNRSTSSLPPPANPLGASEPVHKKKSQRQPGGPPGHPPPLRQLLSPQRVNHCVPRVPKPCERCAAALPPPPSPGDPEPTRFQAIERPPAVAEVTEYQGHARTGPGCGSLTRAVIPAEVRAHSIGPRRTGTRSYFSGCHGLSQRRVEEIADTVFGAPVALGTVCDPEQEVRAARAGPHQEAVAAVRAAEVKNADETTLLADPHPGAGRLET